MIQELLGGGGFLGEGGGGGGDRKFSFHGVVLEGLLSSSTLPSSTPPTTTPTASAASNPTTHVENLRCPRCDSPNTKFCYYNNYNLTQPRHFCKTCRRYWTKGGALRNVPIGGGCRKGKSTILSNTGRSVEGKAKGACPSSSSSSDVVKLYPGSGFGHDQQSVNPILWGSPQNSQLLALLRATPNPNPNPNPNSTSMSNFVNFKDEGEMIGSHVSSGSAVVTQALNARSLGLDPLGQAPVGLYSSFFRNNQYQPHYHHPLPHHHHQQQQQPPQENFSQGDGHNTGIQELYHRLKSSVRYYPDNSSAAVSNVTPMPISSTSMMEPTSIVGGEFNSWNPQNSWSDLPTPNGSFSLDN